MDEQSWQPTCARPGGLVPPVRLDPDGLVGPTRGAARGRRWQRVGPGLYLPGHADLEVVEQRILAQSARLPDDGGVTAWAALRWRGAAYFDGTDSLRRRAPVPLIVAGRGSRSQDPETRYSWEQFPPWEREVVAGVPCALVARALYDETRWSSSDRRATVAVDMTVAASLITVEEFMAYVVSRPAWTGVYRARFAADHASARSRSPRESLMRLVWVLDAALPTPLVNEPVFSLDGSLLGYPDLFDPVAGLVGEYDGADHLREDRRSRDRTREERFRDHGLEYVAVVRGEMGNRALLVRRLRAAYSRASFLPADKCRWTLERPPWFRDRLVG
jgi:hypothetical protein